MGTPTEIKKKSEKQIRKIYMEGSQEISNICIFNILKLKNNFKICSLLYFMLVGVPPI